QPHQRHQSAGRTGLSRRTGELFQTARLCDAAAAEIVAGAHHTAPYRTNVETGLLKARRRPCTLSSMRRIALLTTLFALPATPAFAQAYSGNWACRDATTAKAGILALSGEVYGFASTTLGDQA